MRFDVLTIFPEFFSGPLDYGIIRRARQDGLIDVHVGDLRDFTHDRHRTVDDRPFGGGEGMVLKPEPLFEAVESLLGPSVPSGGRPPANTAIVLLSASGRLFRQPVARRLAGLDRVLLLCGRYEGVDERVAEHLATEELSIGDFVLTGGELAAAVVLDAVTRLLPGALGNEASSLHESFAALPFPGELLEVPPGMPPRTAGIAAPEQTTPVLLDFPQYTRPAEFRGWAVPEVLLSGNHEEIRRWRHRRAWEKTCRNRPDLLARGAPDAQA